MNVVSHLADGVFNMNIKIHILPNGMRKKKKKSTTTITLNKCRHKSSDDCAPYYLLASDIRKMILMTAATQ